MHCNYDRLILFLQSFVKSSKTLLHLDEYISSHAIKMNFLIHVDIAFVASKLNGFFTNMAILIYVHAISTYSARDISHACTRVFFVLKACEISVH